MLTRYFNNNSSTTITADNGARIVVQNGSNFPSQFPFFVTAENSALQREIIRVDSAVDANTWNVTRAQEGSSQILFINGNKIEQRVTAQLLNEVVSGVNASLIRTGDAMTGALFEKSSSLDAMNIDVSHGSLFFKTITGATTFTVSGIPASGSVASFVLEVTNGGSASVTFWSGIKWAGGILPNLTVAGVDIFGFYTRDAGVTWRGLVLAKDSK